MADLESRERIKKLERKLDAAISTFGMQFGRLTAVISGINNFLPVDTYTALAAMNTTGYAGIILKANRSGDFGVYLPYGGGDAANDTSIVADVVGNKYKLYQ